MTQKPSENDPIPADPENPDHRPHKPADDREEIYFEGNPLLRAELGKVFLTALVAAALIAVPILFYKYKPGVLPWWGGVLCVLLAIGCVGIPILLVRSTRFRVSNYRIDYERGIFSKRIDTLELWHVEDVQYRQSLLHRMLNVGTITVISHDETTPRLELAGVPNPRPLFESMKQRIIAVKRQRGVVKMDLG